VRPRLVANCAYERRPTAQATGLEGLPLNAGEAWTFHTIRSGRPTREVRSIVFLWVVVVITAVLGVWGGSIILGTFSILTCALASWWTYTKWPSGREARSQGADDERS
jgi:hypothetical protein